ncbi:MAG: hypothetical protein KAT43_05445 [Nanoarchaeota archaeon]|nr:hypothetical protein [Nanoarchaeota archaeon]
MTIPLPKWLMLRYSILWNKLGDKEFNRSDAIKALKKDKMLNITLSKLRQSGWLEMKLHPKDARKRLYLLNKPEEIIRKMEKG